MNKNLGTRLGCLLLSLVLIFCLLPVTGLAAETVAGKFVLVAEAGGKLVIAPEYVTYTQGQTVKEALEASGHEFYGLDTGAVTAIDGVTGNFTRSDQNGGYDLEQAASNVTHFRFSENSTGSQPSAGLLLLMTAMADYLEKDADVQLAAKDAYQTARSAFVGSSSDNARTLAVELNQAISDYENALSGTKYTVTFTDGSKAYSEFNYPGVAVSAVNAYGKAFADDGDGILGLPAGSYTFTVEQNGLRVEGNVEVSENVSVTATLPADLWLKMDTFRLSGSYGADDNEDNKFTDGEFTLGEWSERQVTVPVEDCFVGAVYTYAEYDTTLLSEVPGLTAVYTMAGSGIQMEKELAFESMVTGAYEVLAKGAAGNTVIYRVSSQGTYGYTYSQDYTVTFRRIPTLTAITVKDQDGTDQAAVTKFDGTITEYTYKVLDTVTSVTVSAQPLDDSYSVSVNGSDAKSGVTVEITGETVVEVVVSANGYTNTYNLTIQPGEGKVLSFLSDNTVTIEVVNSNGVVMPYTTHKETDTQNRYKYTLVPGEVYSYIATNNTYYHIADDFTLEETANSIVMVDFSDMGDWLEGLSLGTNSSSKYKDTLTLEPVFSSSGHSYETTYVDTEHLAYIWVTGSESDASIQAIYDQVFASSLYHGKEYTLELTSGVSTGTQLKRFLMDENPIENTVTIRLSKDVDGVTWYQDYIVDFRRSLTLKSMAAQCDGITMVLTKEDDTTGFDPQVKEYFVTASMAAKTLDLAFTCYEDNPCYGEEQIGYRVKVDGVDVTESGVASIELDGTINTQTVSILVENDKAPNGSTEYILNILKSPPVEATFEIAPTEALLHITEVLSGQRIWPNENGNYDLCEGYSYSYALTRYGYVSKSGTLVVGRDDNNALVVIDGTENYIVSEGDAGGTVTIFWALAQAEANGAINTGLSSSWPNFRGSSTNNGVVSAPIPKAAEEGTLYWANQLGSGFDSDAVGSPILVDGDIITYASDKIYRVDTMTGQVKVTGYMDHKSSFSITPPTYANGMVFVALSNGGVQAFNASTLESLWIYNDPLGGQPNCPLTVKDGYLYTGFWNSETGDANFVCLSITDEDPGQAKESKCASWYYTAKGGYYWAGAYAGDGYVLVGTDDGTNGCTGKSSQLLMLNARTGELLDSWDNLNGDVRSTVVYDSSTNAYYFTSKGGTFYSVQVSSDLKLTNMWSVDLSNGTGGVPMSTCSPVVYNGRAYVGVSGSGQFSPYSGHNITVIDVSGKTIAYRVNTQGYPQTSGLVTTAYDGYAYVYFFDNQTPGKLRVLRDKPGQTSADYVTTEGSHTTAYALFTPTGDQAQYAICSPITDEYGTIYFKNDAAYLMAFGSAIEKLEVTTMPTKTSYTAGETFDPTGMVVTATYANGKTRDVTEAVSWNELALTEEDALFTISYAYGMYHNQENGTEMLSGVATLPATVTLELTVEAGLLGDVNSDGTVDQLDAQMILDHEAQNLEKTLNLAIADVSGDGVIDSNDAVLITQYAAGKITQFPAEDNTEEIAEESTVAE